MVFQTMSFMFFELQQPLNILHGKRSSERFGWFLMPKNDFENTDFANFEEVVHDFGRFDDDMI